MILSVTAPLLAAAVIACAALAPLAAAQDLGPEQEPAQEPVAYM